MQHSELYEPLCTHPEQVQRNLQLSHTSLLIDEETDPVENTNSRCRKIVKAFEYASVVIFAAGIGVTMYVLFR